MKNIIEEEKTTDISSLVIFIAHNNEGVPSIVDGVQIVDLDKLKPYFKEILKGEKNIEEIIPSTHITIILDSDYKPRITCISPDSTREELNEWLERSGGKIATTPWKFEMGKGATYSEFGHLESEFERFNPIIDFLNESSGLAGWAGGLIK
ncbi:hypothetical protein A2154_02070 [Candidatus Gottesmanbacteria bacterium RBG_16_43_7]|uniref:Uncharacterized protein n=1 Tax=Candidatus Gottesmanbacteria bacterium RBG_16_43_7 TaxID=1798373 RepID=A0A1F5Z992_9BACT|nr:MAG: hypothetical protein A2154_02070 [Candidatus Gottesmanbacteria bacterium RBG_16_43_7]